MLVPFRNDVRLVVMSSVALFLLLVGGGFVTAQDTTTTTFSPSSTTLVEKQEANCPLGLTANDIAALSGKDLTGKVALVTGGRSGLGYSISEALLLLNCTVVIASRNQMRNQFAVEDLKDTVAGAQVSYMTFDLEDFASVRSFASDFIGNHSRLDFYFGNAGQSHFVPQPLTVDGFERIFQVNYVSQVLLVELLLPLLRNTPSSRIILTGSSTHPMACGNIGLPTINQTDGDQYCFNDALMDNAIDRLPFDQAGLDAMEQVGGFGCVGFAGTYAITKYLMIQLAKEISVREATAGNEVYAYSFAPGPINTALLPPITLTCCFGPTAPDDYDNFGCRSPLPYVGPKDEFGNPAPPMYDIPVPNFWTSPPHGTMAPIYAALHADPSDAGAFISTYWECEIDKGYYSQGITEQGRAQIYDLSLTWAGLDADSSESAGNVNIERTDDRTMEEESNVKMVEESSSAGSIQVMVASAIVLVTFGLL